MAFKVEDGTGLTDANSFVTVLFADEYFQLRGVAEWQGSNEQKEAWLVQATDYISARFNFMGRQLTEEQALPFPRMGVGPFKMPVALLKATCEYAIRAKDAPLAPDIEVSETGRAIAGKTEKVGPIEDTVSFSVSGPGASLMVFRPYPAADMLLKGLIQRGHRVVRA